MSERSPLVAVTGATGFLGRRVVAELERRGVATRAIGRRAAAGGVSCDVLCDIGDADALRGALSGCTVVIHTAGLAHVFDRAVPAAELDAVNAAGAANLVEAAAAEKVGRVVLASSVAVYGAGEGVRDESSPTRPSTPYGVSKLRGEHLAREIAAREGLELVVLRLATLYGEGDPGNVARLIRAIARGRFVSIGDGRNRKSLLHVDDAARGCVEAALAPALFDGTFNLAGRAHEMREVVGIIARTLGRKPPHRVPAPLVRAPASLLVLATLGAGGAKRLRDTIEKWLQDDVYDSGAFERATGFRSLVALEEGLSREVEAILVVERASSPPANNAAI